MSCEPVAQREKGGYILEALVLDLNGSQPVPAYVVKPKACDGLLSCVLCNHTHGGDYELGKDELICGRAARQSLPYARVLTEQGYAALWWVATLDTRIRACVDPCCLTGF